MHHGKGVKDAEKGLGGAQSFSAPRKSDRGDFWDPERFRSAGAFRKWRYPQSSSISRWDCPFSYPILLGYAHVWKPPIWNNLDTFR